MAVSSLRGAIATFRNQSERGLRRSMLNQLLRDDDHRHRHRRPATWPGPPSW